MQLKTEVNIKIEDKKIIEASKKALEELMYIMEGEAVRLAPVDSGNLRGKIHLEKIDDFKWLLGSGANYSQFVEYGTSPHIIRPINTKALKFKVGGKTIFAKVVHHPGTNAQPFFRTSLDFTKQKVSFVLKKWIK